MNAGDPRRSAAGLALALATLAYVACFAARSLTSPVTPLLTRQFHLSAGEAGLLLAFPLLVGVAARIPAGLLADRYGAQRVYVALLFALTIPMALIGTATSFGGLLFWSFWLGIGNAAFPIGIPYLARWFPARKGFALGVYGMGSLGLALIDFGVPRLAGRFGWPDAFRIVLPVVAAVALAFWAFGAPAPGPAPGPAPRPSSAKERLSLFRTEPVIWAYCLIGMVTLGDLLGMSVYLPTYLAQAYGLDLREASGHAAVFAIVAAVVRPLAGHVADRVGGRRVLEVALVAIAGCALTMDLLPRREVLVAVLPLLGLAVGFGTSALWKLVAERFTKSAGTAAGLVGSAAGFGGFLVPVLMGSLRELSGGFLLGFSILAALAVAALAVSVAVGRRVTREA